MDENKLEYIITDGDKVLENKVISNSNLYPNLFKNLRDCISGTLTKDKFWKIQNNIKVFPFIYKEAQKN
jgi:hypothetical protein